MKEAGCRLLIVGYESGDEQILRNIKKGATIDMALRFTENCHSLGLTIHADFILRAARRDLPDAALNTIDFAERLSTPKPFRFRSRTLIPGTEFYGFAKENALINIPACRTRVQPSVAASRFIPGFSTKAR